MTNPDQIPVVPGLILAALAWGTAIYQQWKANRHG